MNPSQKRIAELLLESHHKDDFSVKLRGELNDLLRESEENREFAARFLLDGETLTELLATDEIWDISARRRHHAPEPSHRPRLFRWIPAAAAALLVVSGLGFWLFQREAPLPVATILDQANAVFDQVLPENGHLETRNYALGSGMVTIGFRNGVKMTVRGPAEFEIVDEFRVILSRGQARAFAPESGHGFTIETPEADLVDLGTEFGVSVDPDSGESQVQVFDGWVDVKQRRGKTPIASLKFGDSARIHRGGVEPIRAPEPNTFPTPADLAVARWQRLDRELREDKDVLFYYAFNRLDDDDRRLVDEAEHGEAIHGKIVGARWVTGRWAGKGALLFDQAGDAVELEIPGELPQFTFSAWLNVDRFDYGLTPILNSAGWEEGDFHLQFSRSQGTVFAAVYPSNLRSAPASPFPLGQWVHLAAVVDIETGKASTWVNGRRAIRSQLSEEAISRPGLCRLGAWLAEDPAKKGRSREFKGRMDEVVLWRRVLSPKEIRRLAARGRP